MPAVITPLDKQERFCAAPFERLLERLYAADIDGVYVCGHTGEGLLLPVSDRKRVAEVAVKNSPREKTVIVHVGAHSTYDAVDLARHACSIGAHAISSLPPGGSYSFPEIKKYYQDLAATSDLPLLVYYFPEASTAVATTEQILELCAIPNVIGLKFTDYDLFRMSILKRHGYVVFNGRDEVLVAGLLMGADGGIGSIYNLIPDLFVRVFRLSRSHKWEEAAQIQQAMNKLIEVMLRFPLLAAIKLLLTWSGIDCGTSLAPCRPLTADEETELRSLVCKSEISSTTLNLR